MPIVGNTRSLGITDKEWEQLDMMLSNDIPLIEVTKIDKPRYQRVKDLGYLNCKVHEDEDTGLQTVVWNESKDRYIEFSVSDKNKAVAFIPEDPFMRNRITLSSIMRDGKHRIEKYYIGTEYIPGSVFTKILEETYKYINTFAVMNENRVVFRSDSNTEAQNKRIALMEDGKQYHVVVAPKKVFYDIIAKCKDRTQWTKHPDFAPHIEKLKQIERDIIEGNDTREMEYRMSKIQARLKEEQELKPDIQIMSLRELKRYAKDNGIELTGKTEEEIRRELYSSLNIEPPTEIVVS